MATPPVLSYEAAVLIGGVAIPATPGYEGGTDEAFVDPDMIGAFWDFDYAIGIQQPSIDINLIPRDKTTEALGSSLLNYWFTRAGDTSNDTSIISGGITYYDGADCWALGNAKFDSCMLNGAKGQVLGMRCRFVGTSWTSTSNPSLSSWDTSPPLMGNQSNFTGYLANIVRRWNLAFSNRHFINPALNGTNTPAAWNAGKVAVQLTVEVRANDIVPATGSSIGLVIAGNNLTRTFTMPNVRLENPRRRGVQPGEVLRNYRYTALGGDSRTIPPLSFS